MLKVVLASASQARKILLERLQIPFECIASHVEEIPLENEAPDSLVKRLAKEKAEAVASQCGNSLIIGADTIGILNNHILCKPLTEEKAVKQLQMMSGKTVTFFTGLCLLNSKNNEKQVDVDICDVSFRVLSDEMIKKYLQKEYVLDCAGSLNIEKFGITLVEKISGSDYTGLIGLPLMKLTKMFETMGFPLM